MQPQTTFQGEHTPDPLGGVALYTSMYRMYPPSQPENPVRNVIVVKLLVQWAVIFIANVTVPQVIVLI